MISVLCPTRNRPENVRRLLTSINSTASSPVEVVFYTDSDAPLIGLMPENVLEVNGPRITLSAMWNECYARSRGEIVMQCGDDIVFRTPGWDLRVIQEFEQVPDRVALVYGNDLLHGQALATHGFVHRTWVEAVGHFTPPYFSSDFGDQWLFDVAIMLGRLRYMPDVVTEHMHPVVGKGPWDMTHQERLARHAQDNVAAKYAETLPERQRDAEVLRKLLL